MSLQHISRRHRHVSKERDVTKPSYDSPRGASNRSSSDSVLPSYVSIISWSSSITAETACFEHGCGQLNGRRSATKPSYATNLTNRTKKRMRMKKIQRKMYMSDLMSWEVWSGHDDTLWPQSAVGRDDSGRFSTSRLTLFTNLDLLSHMGRVIPSEISFRTWDRMV